ncbi:MAG TPA: OpgC domain-containing protein, partial [Agitococcus sp.]|nr:OpgC domain-containing protein [Agitococcus sp.]
VSLILFFIAQNHTNPFLPSWAKLNLIEAHTFNYIYENYAQKNSLGVVRVLNDFCLLVTLYWLLTICWTPFYKALGWYLIPVGQASLYVFIIHVYVVLLASQLVSFNLSPNNNWLITSTIHGGSLMLLWWMTKKEVGMKYIPN